MVERTSFCVFIALGIKKTVLTPAAGLQERPGEGQQTGRKELAASAWCGLRTSTLKAWVSHGESVARKALQLWPPREMHPPTQMLNVSA